MGPRQLPPVHISISTAQGQRDKGFLEESRFWSGIKNAVTVGVARTGKGQLLSWGLTSFCGMSSFDLSLLLSVCAGTCLLSEIPRGRDLIYHLSLQSWELIFPCDFIISGYSLILCLLPDCKGFGRHWQISVTKHVIFPISPVYGLIDVFRVFV